MFAVIPIPSSDVVFDLAVRIKCMECPAYGKRYSCPPYTPFPSVAKKLLNSFSYALVCVAKIPMKPIYDRVWHLPPINRMVMAHKIVNAKKASLNKGFQKFAQFFEGKAFAPKAPCTLCKTCGAPNNPCKNPQKRTHAPESFGIDVYETLEKIGIPFEAPPRTYATVVGMIFTDTYKKVEKDFSIESLDDEKKSWIESLREKRKSLIKGEFVEMRAISPRASSLFPWEDVKTFVQGRKALIFRKVGGERNLLALKDYLAEMGLWDVVAVGEKEDFKHPRALVLTPKELGVDIALEKGEIALLTKRIHTAKKLIDSSL